MQYKVLIVDDEDDHQKVVRKVLDRSCRVVQALTLADADRELLKQNFDLILLDVTLPDGDGFSFYAKLRTQEHTADTPVMFVTSRSDTPNEVMGFSLGAEDYIAKPIDPPRLKARVESRLKLISERRQKEMTLCKGNLKLSVSLQKVSVVNEGQEIPIDLTPVEFKLLFHLLRHEDQVFSREQLLIAVWDNASEVFDRTVDMHVSKLRKKINLSDFQIKAVHGLGYRLSKAPIPPVTFPAS
ncbi:MAG: response regulator transcription factor [Bacteriovoracia bacterium]